jgi:hypothetical protein
MLLCPRWLASRADLSHRSDCLLLTLPLSRLQKSEAWHSLDRSQVELIASHLACEMDRLKQLLAELEPPSGVSGAPKRRAWW